MDEDTVRADPAPIGWTSVTDDLWVAAAGGDFLGTIERIEDRFVAIDGRGVPLGVNGSLEGAKQRLETVVLVGTGASPAPRGPFRAIARRLRRGRPGVAPLSA
jgi:hypothetical protein